MTDKNPSTETLNAAVAALKHTLPRAAKNLQVAVNAGPRAIAATASRINLHLARHLEDAAYENVAALEYEAASRALSALVREIVQ